MFEIKDEYVLVRPRVTTRDDVILMLSDALARHGAVSPEYGRDVLQREQQYPTGLPTQGIKVAIPHAGSEHVIRSAMAVALLDKPVTFHCMDKPEEGLPVRIVFLLANKKPDEQVKFLRSIMSLFEDGANLRSLHVMPDAASVSAFLRDRMARAAV